MSITKGDLVIRALKVLGVVDSITSADPEEIRDGLDTLDAMVAEWESHGIRLGYILSSSESPSMPDDASGLADIKVFGVVQNLAVNLAPMLGREAAPTVRSRAKIFYEGLFNVDLIQRQSDPMMPAGTGNCYIGGYQPPDDDITIENDGNLVL
ncbi:MAG: packaged DNA stabilization gp4 family protein [Aeromonadaceae bacterium]